MLDPEIRKAFIKQYLLNQSKKSLIFEEVGILRGKSIVDIALFNNDFFQAFEIKSGSDGIQRLPNQIESYAHIFDSITLITEESQVMKMSKMIPAHWGLIVVKKVFENIEFDVLKLPKRNLGIQKMSLAQFLWRDEAMQALKRRGYKRISSKKVKALWNMIVNNLSVEEIRSEIVIALKSRGDWKNPLAYPPIEEGE